jgi:hypothetical protein
MTFDLIALNCEQLLFGGPAKNTVPRRNICHFKSYVSAYVLPT